MFHVPSALRRAVPLAVLVAASFAVQAAPLSTSFSITGQVANPVTYDLASLQTRPAITQTVTFLSGSTPQTHTYTGASLWGMLDGAGLLSDPGAQKNDVLNKIVIATATDGYKVVLSLGELNPNFGNRPDLVAYRDENGPLSSDGFARITVPGDTKGGRYLSNLVGLQVQESASKVAATDGKPSTSFTVSGDVKSAATFDLAGLKNLQGVTTITKTIDNVTYTGVSLWDLLASSVGLALDPNVKNDDLGKYVVATGSDGYKSVFSLGELDPSFGGMQDFIAYTENGVDLTTDGFARIVAPDDVRHGRWVSNLISLEVFSANVVPEPGTWLLLITGLVAMLAFGRSRVRSTGAMAVAT